MGKLNLFFVSIISILYCINIQPQNKVPKSWLTKFEKSGYTETERYDETMRYFRDLADNSEYAKFFTFGFSPQGREIKCLVVSKDKAFTPSEAKKTGKPIILINNGIHSGEIEGKDASMLLLREILITKEKEDLIDNAILLVVPIFSVDAHERFSAFNRINQNGPKEMGWRTTAQNLNLNRDWMKADAPEMQAMLKLFSDWLPDFLVDTHTTDGADYQYTITYAMETFRNIYSKTAEWTKEKFIPYLIKNEEDAGYLITSYISLKDWGSGLEKGIEDWATTPRFSQGYAAVQNRPGLLIETHMLKPYKDRVFSTKVMLNSVISYINDNPNELIKLNKEADEQSIEKYAKGDDYLPLAYGTKDTSTNILFKGIKFRKDSSWISGTTKIVYTGEKEDMQIPYYNQLTVTDSVSVPIAYLIPKEWGEWDNIIDRIKLHGIEVDQLEEDNVFEVTKYKFKNIKFANSSYESHQRVDCDYDVYQETDTIPQGTYIIKTDQRTIRVLVNLLEPKSGDSFLRWGFFNSIFERKEYFESYVMEKYAEKMMEKNPDLKEEFEKKLKEDEKFRKNPYERLNFFYKRSPYFDKELNVYPVMRLDNM